MRPSSNRRRTVCAGDRFLLCSDGLTGHVADEEIAALSWTGRRKRRAMDLLALTLERGARDNVSIIVVDCAEDVAA